MTGESFRSHHALWHRAIAVMALCFVATASANAKQIHAAEVLRDAPKGWIALSKAIDQLTFRAEVHHLRLFDGSPYRDQVTVFLHSPDSDMQEMRIKTYEGTNTQIKNNIGVLVCRNPMYLFEAERKTADAPWNLISVAWKSDSSESSRGLERIEGGWSILRASVEIDGGIVLDQLFRQPEFRIRDCQLKQVNDMQCVSITFENRHPIPDASKWSKDYYPVQSGVLTLCPEKKWALVDYELSYQTPNRDLMLSGKVEYVDNAPSNAVLPKHVTKKTVFLRANDTSVKIAELRQEYEYDFSSSAVNNDQFRMSHYGFREPFTNAKPRPSSQWAAWCAIGLGACIFAVVTRNYFRRRYDVSAN